jgi:hypothetical protein
MSVSLIFIHHASDERGGLVPSVVPTILVLCHVMSLLAPSLIVIAVSFLERMILTCPNLGFASLQIT